MFDFNLKNKKIQILLKLDINLYILKLFNLYIKNKKISLK